MGFGIDIQTPMEDFSKQQEIEREMSYYELFQRLMNGNHSAQMVKKVLFYVKSDFVIPNASFFSGNQWCTNFKTESQISTQTIFLIFNICW